MYMHAKMLNTPDMVYSGFLTNVLVLATLRDAYLTKMFHTP